MYPQLRSRPDAVVALAVAPPYYSNLWLGMGPPLVDALLAQVQIRAALVQIADDVWQTPTALGRFAALRMLRPVTQAQTHACLNDPEVGAWLDRAAARLAEGPEQVVGLSVWRHNVDVSMALARRVKQLKPNVLVLIGGPHAVEDPESCQDDAVDVIVHGQAEALVAPVVTAMLASDWPTLAQLHGIWLHPRRGHALPTIAQPTPGPLPRIDYTSLVPFIAQTTGTHKPHIPVLLNLGCPFHCSFCTNTTIYPQLQGRQPEHVVAEIIEAADAWRGCMGEHNRPQFSFCDATVNALPDVWDRVLDGVIDHFAADQRPQLHGCLIVDSRITAARVERFVAAGYGDGFFGLESASETLRRQIKKPGRIDAVTRGLETLHAASGGTFRLGMGVIIGHPQETDACFGETLDFVRRALAAHWVTELNVAPLIRTAAAMDAALLGHASGDAYGVLWRDTGPAGAPALRAQRLRTMMALAGPETSVTTAGPLDIVLHALQPDLPLAELAEQLPKSAAPPSAKHPDVARAEARLQAHPQQRAWRLMECMPRGEGAQAGIAVSFRGADGQHAAVVVTLHADGAPAFCRAGALDIAYLREFHGRPCVFDATLLHDLAALLSSD